MNTRLPFIQCVSPTCVGNDPWALIEFVPRLHIRNRLNQAMTDLGEFLKPVSQIVRDVSAEFILPSFQNLDKDKHHVREKRPGELVTDIDIRVEQALTDKLTRLLPGSRVLGEESYEQSPESLLLCQDSRPVWIVDPIDGTQNYADGSPHFALLLAFRHNRRTEMAWLYDPIKDLLFTTVRGQGVWRNEVPLKKADVSRDIRQLKGSVGNRLRKAHETLAGDGEKNIPSLQARLRCCGQEYMALADDRIQFLQYGVRLKPWDHAAGVLMAEELGFHSAFLEGETPYNPVNGEVNGYLMLAPDRDSWLGLRDTLWNIETASSTPI